MHAIAGRERGTNHLLGARLAARAGDRHDRCALGEHPAARASQKPERHQRVIHLKKGQPGDPLCAAPDDRPYGTHFPGLRQEGVRVEVGPLESDEEAIGDRVSGIGRDTTELEFRRRLYTKCSGNLRTRPPPSAFHAAPSWRMISRSSNGNFSVPIT